MAPPPELQPRQAPEWQQADGGADVAEEAAGQLPGSQGAGGEQGVVSRSLEGPLPQRQLAMARLQAAVGQQQPAVKVVKRYGATPNKTAATPQGATEGVDDLLAAAAGLSQRQQALASLCGLQAPASPAAGGAAGRACGAGPPAVAAPPAGRGLGRPPSPTGDKENSGSCVLSPSASSASVNEPDDKPTRKSQQRLDDPGEHKGQQQQQQQQQRKRREGKADKKLQQQGAAGAEVVAAGAEKGLGVQQGSGAGSAGAEAAPMGGAKPGPVKRAASGKIAAMCAAFEK